MPKLLIVLSKPRITPENNAQFAFFSSQKYPGILLGMDYVPQPHRSA